MLEAVVYGICHEDTTREQANQALSRFKDEFFDWNEVRVSPIDEIQETLAGIPDPEARAQRIRRFLRQLFEKTYGFTLDALTKKPLKEALKVLQRIRGVHVRLRHGHGGPAGPGRARHPRRRLDPPRPRPAGDRRARPSRALRSVLERAVPKNRGVEFLELIEELAHDTCVESAPDCPRCELRKVCPFSLAKKYELPSPPADPGRARQAAAAKASGDGAKAARKPAEKEKPKDAYPPCPLPPPPRPRPPPAKEAPPAKSDKRKSGGAK